jgi:hypothetical protein
MTETAIAPPLPLVSQLTKEQRKALMVDLIKAHFADAGMPWYLPVRDGNTLLGIFHPEFPRPEKSSIPDFPPEYIAELKRRVVEEEKEELLLTTEEVLHLLEMDYDRRHPEL